MVKKILFWPEFTILRSANQNAGYVAEFNAEQTTEPQESWYIPHHLVGHNGKHCNRLLLYLSMSSPQLTAPTWPHFRPIITWVFSSFSRNRESKWAENKTTSQVFGMT